MASVQAPFIIPIPDVEGWQGWVVLALIAFMLFALVAELAPPYLVMMGTLIILMSLSIIDVQAAFHGFSDTAMLSVAVLFVVAKGIETSGGLEYVASVLFKVPNKTRVASAGVRRRPSRSGGSLVWVLIKFTIPVAMFSAFLANIPLVAMMIPPILEFAKKVNIPSSKMLMPLSYAAQLGGTMTLIGASTNLVVLSMSAQKLPNMHMSLFEIGMVGMPVTIAGILYILAFSGKVLPERDAIPIGAPNPREYNAVLAIKQNSKLARKSIDLSGLGRLPGLHIVAITRGVGGDGGPGTRGLIRPRPGVQSRGALEATATEQSGLGIVAVTQDPAGTFVLQATDKIHFVGVVDAILLLMPVKGLELTETEGQGEVDLNLLKAKQILVEAVIASKSSMVNERIADLQFRTRFNAVVVAIHRHGKRLTSLMGEVRVEAGDCLLMIADSIDFVAKHRNNSHFALVSQLPGFKPINRQKALIASILVVAMVVASGVGVDLIRAALFSSAGLLLTRCLTPQDAMDSIEVPVLIMIAAAFGIAEGMVESGAASILAKALMGLAGKSKFGLISCTYVATTLFSLAITNSAAVTIMFPVALAAANHQALDFRPFAYTLMMGASAGLMTPTACPSNLMVYGPGSYKFSDYINYGGPLQLWLLFVTVGVTMSSNYWFVWAIILFAVTCGATPLLARHRSTHTSSAEAVADNGKSVSYDNENPNGPDQKSERKFVMLPSGHDIADTQSTFPTSSSSASPSHGKFPNPFPPPYRLENTLGLPLSELPQPPPDVSTSSSSHASQDSDTSSPFPPPYRLDDFALPSGGFSSICLSILEKDPISSPSNSSIASSSSVSNSKRNLAAGTIVIDPSTSIVPNQRLSPLRPVVIIEPLNKASPVRLAPAPHLLPPPPPPVRPTPGSSSMLIPKVQASSCLQCQSSSLAAPTKASTMAPLAPTSQPPILAQTHVSAPYLALGPNQASFPTLAPHNPTQLQAPSSTPASTLDPTSFVPISALDHHPTSFVQVSDFAPTPLAITHSFTPTSAPPTIDPDLVPVTPALSPISPCTLVPASTPAFAQTPILAQPSYPFEAHSQSLAPSLMPESLVVEPPPKVKPLTIFSDSKHVPNAQSKIQQFQMAPPPLNIVPSITLNESLSSSQVAQLQAICPTSQNISFKPSMSNNLEMQATTCTSGNTSLESSPSILECPALESSLPQIKSRETTIVPVHFEIVPNPPQAAFSSPSVDLETNHLDSHYVYNLPRVEPVPLEVNLNLPENESSLSQPKSSSLGIMSSAHEVKSPFSIPWKTPRVQFSPQTEFGDSESESSFESPKAESMVSTTESPKSLSNTPSSFSQVEIPQIASSLLLSDSSTSHSRFSLQDKKTNPKVDSFPPKFESDIAMIHSRACKLEAINTYNESRSKHVANFENFDVHFESRIPESKFIVLKTSNNTGDHDDHPDATLAKVDSVCPKIDFSFPGVQRILSEMDSDSYSPSSSSIKSTSPVATEASTSHVEASLKVLPLIENLKEKNVVAHVSAEAPSLSQLATLNQITPLLQSNAKDSQSSSDSFSPIPSQPWASPQNAPSLSQIHIPSSSNVHVTSSDPAPQPALSESISTIQKIISVSPQPLATVLNAPLNVSTVFPTQITQASQLHSAIAITPHADSLSPTIQNLPIQSSVYLSPIIPASAPMVHNHANWGPNLQSPIIENLPMIYNHSIEGSAPSQNPTLMGSTILSPMDQSPSILHPMIHNHTIHESATIQNPMTSGSRPLSSPITQSPSILGPLAHGQSTQIPNLQSTKIQSSTIPSPTIQSLFVLGPQAHDQLIQNPDLQSPIIQNPAISGSTISSPTFQSPSIPGPIVYDHTLQGPNLHSGTIQNPLLASPTILMPVVQSPANQILTTHSHTNQGLNLQSPVQSTIIQNPTLTSSIVHNPVLHNSIMESPRIYSTSFEWPVDIGSEPSTEQNSLRLHLVQPVGFIEQVFTPHHEFPKQASHDISVMSSIELPFENTTYSPAEPSSQGGNEFPIMPPPTELPIKHLGETLVEASAHGTTEFFSNSPDNLPLRHPMESMTEFHLKEPHEFTAPPPDQLPVQHSIESSAQLSIHDAYELPMMPHNESHVQYSVESFAEHSVQESTEFLTPPPDELLVQSSAESFVKTSPKESEEFPSMPPEKFPVQQNSIESFVESSLHDSKEVPEILPDHLPIQQPLESSVLMHPQPSISSSITPIVQSLFHFGVEPSTEPIMHRATSTRFVSHMPPMQLMQPAEFIKLTFEPPSSFPDQPVENLPVMSSTGLLVEHIVESLTVTRSPAHTNSDFPPMPPAELPIPSPSEPYVHVEPFIQAPRQISILSPIEFSGGFSNESFSIEHTVQPFMEHSFQPFSEPVAQPYLRIPTFERFSEPPIQFSMVSEEESSFGTTIDSLIQPLVNPSLRSLNRSSIQPFARPSFHPSQQPSLLANAQSSVLDQPPAPSILHPIPFHSSSQLSVQPLNHLTIPPPLEIPISTQIATQSPLQNSPQPPTQPFIQPVLQPSSQTPIQPPHRVSFQPFVKHFIGPLLESSTKSSVRPSAPSPSSSQPSTEPFSTDWPEASSNPTPQTSPEPSPKPSAHSSAHSSSSTPPSPNLSFDPDPISKVPQPPPSSVIEPYITRPQLFPSSPSLRPPGRPSLQDEATDLQVLEENGLDISSFSKIRQLGSRSGASSGSNRTRRTGSRASSSSSAAARRRSSRRAYSVAGPSSSRSSLRSSSFGRSKSLSPDGRPASPRGSSAAGPRRLTTTTGIAGTSRQPPQLAYTGPQPSTAPYRPRTNSRSPRSRSPSRTSPYRRPTQSEPLTVLVDPTATTAPTAQENSTVVPEEDLTGGISTLLASRRLSSLKDTSAFADNYV